MAVQLDGRRVLRILERLRNQLACQRLTGDERGVGIARLRELAIDLDPERDAVAHIQPGRLARVLDDVHELASPDPPGEARATRRARAPS